MIRLSWQKNRTIPAVAFCCAAVVLTTWLASHGDEIDKPQPLLTPPPVPSGFDHSKSEIDRSRFSGARACLDCHRSEYISWLNTQHYSNTNKNRFEATESSLDTKYLKEVGNLDLCYTCHSAPPEQRFGRRAVETGTSCESCHGASGSESGWLNRHAVYGPNVTRLENETPQHLADRLSYCESAGMIRPSQPYEVAKNCFGCHIIGEPTLVGDNVKHPVSFETFSLLPYLLGEVRHNFHLDQRSNADTPTVQTLRHGISLANRKRVYIVVEQFAKMEVALNYLAALPGDAALGEDFASRLADIVEKAAGELKDIASELEKPGDEKIEGLSKEELASLNDAVTEFSAFKEIDPATLTLADASKCAAKIAGFAAQFVATHDGSRLAALDSGFIAGLADPKGEVLKSVTVPVLKSRSE